jgi:hypothetical protein
MKRLYAAVLLFFVAACSEPLPLCEKPEALPGFNQYGMQGAFFDLENLKKLGSMIRGLDEGTCRIDAQDAAKTKGV